MSNFLTNVRVFFIESEENRKLTNNIDELWQWVLDEGVRRRIWTIEGRILKAYTHNFFLDLDKYDEMHEYTTHTKIKDYFYIIGVIDIFDAMDKFEFSIGSSIYGDFSYRSDKKTLKDVYLSRSCRYIGETDKHYINR